MTGVPSTGTRFGRYQILRRIGAGGMGVVYEARDESLGRSVALKVLSPGLSLDDGFQQRFRREAALLARLDSPHLIQVHDFGEQDGCLFIVSPFLAEGDLDHRLRRLGALERGEALGLVRDVLAGLVDAHDQGVVHRDVKPSNVLLRRRGDHLGAVLCDFGIATSEDTGLTATGVMVGSLAYMAPERHDGTAATVTSDVYSVGCLLWVTLTGAPPFSGTGVQMAIAHAQTEIPQLPGDDPVTVAVNTILRTSMAKDPADRYPRAADLLAEVARVQALLERSIDTATRPVLSTSPPGVVGPTVDDSEGVTEVKGPRSDAAAAVVPVAPAPDADPGEDATEIKVVAPAPPGPPAPPAADLHEATVVTPAFRTSPSAPAVTSAPDVRSPEPAPAARSRATLVALLVVAAAVVLIAATVAVIVLGSSDDPPAAAEDGAGAPASPGADPSSPDEVDLPATTPAAVAPEAPAAPTVKMVSGYRSVRFAISGDGEQQVKAPGGQWRDVELPGVLETTTGGTKVCAHFRSVARAGDLMTPSRSVRRCATSKKPTLELVNVPTDCPPSGTFTCYAYDAVATGLRPGARPRLVISPCASKCTKTLKVDEDGRARLREAVFLYGGSVTVTVANLRATATV